MGLVGRALNQVVVYTFVSLLACWAKGGVGLADCVKVFIEPDVSRS